jgi:uncharacterized protein YceH (UPF0502 family)
LGDNYVDQDDLFNCQVNNKRIENRAVPLKLSANECRVIGCLMEKSVVTPDQYPLTLNALTNACNQKSSRNPVMSLPQGEVQHTARKLEAKHLVRIEEGFRSGVEKYSHRFCNTSFGDLQLDSAQFAIVCLLLLRGAQTPGELRANSGRLHDFEDNNAVVETIDNLPSRDGDPMVVKLPRQPGRKDSEYMHLFDGPIDTSAMTIETGAESPVSAASSTPSLAQLAQRLTDLEQEVARLKRALGEPE